MAFGRRAEEDLRRFFRIKSRRLRYADPRR
jgi:hypothetical protein